MGIFDDDAAKHGRQVHGIDVLGSLADIAHWSGSLAVKDAIIAMPEATHSVRRRALELARNAGLNVLTVPAFDDLLSASISWALKATFALRGDAKEGSFWLARRKPSTSAT